MTRTEKIEALNRIIAHTACASCRIDAAKLRDAVIASPKTKEPVPRDERPDPAPDMFAAYRYHPNCTSATGWCPVCARVQQSTFRAPTPQFRDYEGDVIAGPDPFRDARVDASVAYAAGAAAGREFGRGEAAPAPTVGCEDADGLLHVHPESATCAVCAPTVHAPKETP